MITAIIMRLVAEFKDELCGFLDLYSTLQTNIKIYKINYWIGGVLTSIEFCCGLKIWEYVEQYIPAFMFIEVCIITLGMYFGAWLLGHKKDIKTWMKKKHPKKVRRTTKKPNMFGEGI